MKNYTFLLPLYNDWKSLQKLIDILNKQLKRVKIIADFLIVDDCSPIKNKVKFKNKKNIKSIKIIRLKKNVGSQKAISIGLNYLNKIKDKSLLTILDSDGEDDPGQIQYMIENVKRNPKFVTVSCRSKRGEGFIFKILYFFHKLITFLFTFKWISFGNYASFNSNLIKEIVSDNSSWFALSSAYIKNSNIKRLYAKRNKRYYGKSKLGLIALLIHSIRINCVFLKRIFFISVIYLIISYNISIIFFKLILILIIFFNLALVIVYYQSNPKEYSSSEELIDEVINLK